MMPLFIIIYKFMNDHCILQVVFAHLACGVEPWFEPRGFWRAFKDYDGQPVNIRWASCFWGGRCWAAVLKWLVQNFKLPVKPSHLPQGAPGSMRVATRRLQPP